MERIVIKLPQAPQVLPRLKRTAGYARVSSGTDDMLNSLSAQISYYNECIQKMPGCTFAGVYADEAMTGTKSQRAEFQRLLDDCRAGLIDQVLVKSITRFARNTVTLLETVRELKALGIERRALMVFAGANEMLSRASGNIPGLKTARVSTLNAVDILSYDKFVIAKEAVTQVEEVYA